MGLFLESYNEGLSSRDSQRAQTWAQNPSTEPQGTVSTVPQVTVMLPLPTVTLGQCTHLAGDLQCLSLRCPCPVCFSGPNYSSVTKGCWTVLHKFGKYLSSVLSVLSTALGVDVQQ